MEKCFNVECDLTVVAFLRYGRSVEAVEPDNMAGYAEVKRCIVLTQLITVCTMK